MSELRVIGAGLGRTATNSLKVALERLLGGRCYHMFELMRRPEDLPAWELALDGDASGIAATLSTWDATVDWPGCALWRELADANPRAPILLSTRASATEWWSSMQRTIVPALDHHDRAEPAWPRRHALLLRLFERSLGPDWREPGRAMAGYERHNAEVRAAVAPERLIDWRPGDGWEPICAALGIAVPGDPFPHENRSADFFAKIGVERR
jgi:Sulfotransferase domain